MKASLHLPPSSLSLDLRPSTLSRLRPSRKWAEHLQRDLRRDWTIPWDTSTVLPDDARNRIAASIAEFQRGESSEARSYLAASARFSRRTGDAWFHSASRLFVAAENAHADLLLRFMNETGIPVRPRSVRDGVFRRVRRLGDLGWSSRVLLVAELIAQEYYPCLRVATNHPALVRACDRIIAEEAGHIRFQLERIARLERSLGWLATRTRDLLHTTLMLGTAAVVYAGHRPVLETKLTFRAFVARVLARQRRALASLQQLRADQRHASSSVSRCDSIWRTTMP